MYVMSRRGADYLKTEIINQLIKAYEENNLEKCETKLFFLMLSYNADIILERGSLMIII